MKRKQYCFCLIMLLLLTITACSNKTDGSNTKPTQTLNQGTATPSQAEPTKIVDEMEPTVTIAEQNNDQTVSVSYPYEQELNILDDNYQTYYEVFVYSFCDSDGDGIGDLNGLTSKLDYIADLGFRGIWLMPIMPSTSYHKYDVIDYYAIDKQYGTLDDFKKFMEECNKRGIKVILDLVVNHSSSRHEWFLSAKQSLTIEPCGQEVCTSEPLCREHNPYCNYYNFSRGTPDNSLTPYYPVDMTGWFYEGDFWDQMPDLNLTDANLRKDLEDIMTYWLEMGVGGFRLDAALHFFPNHTEKNNEVLSWLTNFVKGKNPSNYLVAEVWTGANEYLEYYKSGIDSIFNFSFATEAGKISKTLNYTGSEYSGQNFGASMVSMYHRILEKNPNGIDAPFFTNHDTGRAAGYLRKDEDKIKMGGAMNLFMNGNVFVYYGEELGMTGSGKDENKRAPMYWSESKTAGTTNPPPNMEAQEHKFGSFEEQKDNPLSIYNYYKRAIRLKNENPEIARGVPALIEGIDDEDICAITKTFGDNKIIMVYNFSASESKSVVLDKIEHKYSEIRGYVSSNGEEAILEGDTVTIPPYSVVILK